MSQPRKKRIHFCYINKLLPFLGCISIIRIVLINKLKNLLKEKFNVFEFFFRYPIHYATNFRYLSSREQTTGFGETKIAYPMVLPSLHCIGLSCPCIYLTVAVQLRGFMMQGCFRSSYLRSPDWRVME